MIVAMSTGEPIRSSLLGNVGRALEKGDLQEAKRLLAAHPQQLREMTPFGTWLHYIAGEGNLDLVEHLVGLGLDVNAPDHRDGRLPIDAAASNGHANVVRYLLNHGSRLDTSSETRNPLFGAIMGRSVEVVRLLLDRGIDATVRYGPKTATGFALWQGQREIARVIAQHIAGGDGATAETILEEEAGVAARQGSPKAKRVLPTLDDLKPD
jgi:ankyrin repeat protein